MILWEGIETQQGSKIVNIFNELIWSLRYLHRKTNMIDQFMANGPILYPTKTPEN